MNKYIILPFRHTQFSDSSILIVNEAGDYLFISDKDFENFVEYNLDKTEHVFLNPKSKHFLTDTPLFSRKFLCSLADLALPLVCS